MNGISTVRRRPCRLRLAVRWTASLLIALFVASLAVLPAAAAEDRCSCGMTKGCFCELLAAKGSHCDLRAGSCSMKSARTQPDAGALVAAGLSLHGWPGLRAQAGVAVPEPAGAVPAAAFRPPSSPSPRPTVPPPRPFQVV